MEVLLTEIDKNVASILFLICMHGVLIAACTMWIGNKLDKR